MVSFLWPVATHTRGKAGRIQACLSASGYQLPREASPVPTRPISSQSTQKSNEIKTQLSPGQQSTGFLAAPSLSSTPPWFIIPGKLRRGDDELAGGDAGGTGAGGAVPEQGGGEGQDLQGHPVRLQVHQQRPARHRAERRQVHHLGPQGLPPLQVGERPARSHQPSRQRDPSHAGLAREVQERAAVDLPVPGPVRVGREIRDLPEQGAHGPYSPVIPLLLDGLLGLLKLSRAWRAQEAVESDEEARQGAQGYRRQIRGRAVPGEDEAVGRPAAGAGEGRRGRRGGGGAPAAGAQQGHPQGHRRARLHHLAHLLLSATPVSCSAGQGEGVRNGYESRRCCLHACLESPSNGF